MGVMGHSGRKMVNISTEGVDGTPATASIRHKRFRKINHLARRRASTAEFLLVEKTVVR
jgi:hypothetical protein